MLYIKCQVSKVMNLYTINIQLYWCYSLQANITTNIPIIARHRGNQSHPLAIGR